MKTNLIQALLNTPEGAEAEKILRSCVHCGFCNATCPTYQLLGDELDGPRGRIYLIKQALEGGPASRKTQQHLDRCLTCRSCETTCPSGVRYSRLLDIGRAHINRSVPRSWVQRLSQFSLRKLFLSRSLFTAVLRSAQAVRPLLVGELRVAVPRHQADLPFSPQPQPQSRKVLLISGCVQPGLRPRIDTAARIVFERLGIECLSPSSMAPPNTRCCGSLSHHLNVEDQAHATMRANIDHWWPLIEDGKLEAICMTASGCGLAIRDYARHFAHDADYAEKAKAISDLYRDPAEIVSAALADGCSLVASAERVGEKLGEKVGKRIAFHPPCTLQHGQKLGGVIESILAAQGYHLLPFRDSHLCCGSAGTYAITQKQISRQLRTRKLKNIQANAPDCIATANIGCHLHLQGGTQTPVRHWLELLV